MLLAWLVLYHLPHTFHLPSLLKLLDYHLNHGLNLIQQNISCTDLLQYISCSLTYTHSLTHTLSHTHTHTHLSVNVRPTRIHLQCLLEAGALYLNKSMSMKLCPAFPGSSQYFRPSPLSSACLWCVIKAIILPPHSATIQENKIHRAIASEGNL